MPEPEERPRRRWLGPGRFRRWLLAGVAVVVLVIVAAVVFVLVHKPHNVSHPDLSFTVSTATATTATTAKKPTTAAADHFSWPTYGYSNTRTRDFTEADANLHPPFHRGWQLPAGGPLEFPPVIYGHTLWFMNDNATLKSVNTVTGKLNWQKSMGTLSAATPALSTRDKLLVMPTLSDSGSSPGNGQIVAVNLAGKVVWHHPLAAGGETSPLISRNTVFYGDAAGHVYSANLKTGHVNWTFQASGAVKGGAAMSGNNLYVDDYGGNVYDINPRNGHQIWEASADGGDLGFSSGTFYSTPAVAFGRVYVGNTSGYIYSFAASTGQLAWSYGTGAYVYSSAAVADIPGLGPTVYMGSYNGDFYAFNAQSGAIRWVHRDAHDDRISGSATIVNNVVYYSDLDDDLTTGLNVRTGKVVYSFADGGYTPVVADPDHIFLSGHYNLYELLPKAEKQGSVAAPVAHKRVLTKAKHHTAPVKRRSATQKRVAARKHAATVGKHAAAGKPTTLRERVAARKRALARRRAAARKRALARKRAQARASTKKTATKRK